MGLEIREVNRNLTSRVTELTRENPFSSQNRIYMHTAFTEYKEINPHSAVPQGTYNQNKGSTSSLPKSGVQGTGS